MKSAVCLARDRINQRYYLVAVIDLNKASPEVRALQCLCDRCIDKNWYSGEVEHHSIDLSESTVIHLVNQNLSTSSTYELFEFARNEIKRMDINDESLAVDLKIALLEYLGDAALLEYGL